MSWLESPSDATLHVATGDQWQQWNHADLADLALRAAGALRARGIGAGDTVGVVLRGGPDFLAGVFGALALGAAVSPMAPPTLFANLDEHRDHLAGLLGASRPAALLAGPEHAELVTSAAVQAGLDVPLWSAADLPTEADPVEPFPARPEDIALVQFTSGSSGRCRGVAVSRQAVEHNLAAVASWLQMAPGDITVSWLPVHHDMGLIGCLLTPVVHGTDLHLMAPEQFVRDPARYLRRLGAGGQLSAMPTFGLAHIVRRVRPAQLEGCDFSLWRALIVGAERVDPALLGQFGDLLRPFGFDPMALLPAYGLAEATLAVTGVGLHNAWTSVRIETGAVVAGDRVAVGAGDRADDRHGNPVCSSGRALPGASVSVVDDDGAPVAEGVVGEIVVGGRSVAHGYVTADDRVAGSSSINGGTVRTGDGGFLLDGQLFVLGRLGDAVKVRGRSLFAEDVELALARSGVPSLRCAALLGERAGRPTVVALLEKPEQGWTQIAEAEGRRLAPEADVWVVAVPRGGIARTTSGKPRRRQLWQSFVRGELFADLDLARSDDPVVDADPSGARPGRAVPDPEPLDPEPLDQTSRNPTPGRRGMT